MYEQFLTEFPSAYIDAIDVFYAVLGIDTHCTISMF